MFRTSPCSPVGQRRLVLHDGRTADLLEAIYAHRSAANARFVASEANATVTRFQGLSEAQKQDVLNFLRSL